MILVTTLFLYNLLLIVNNYTTYARVKQYETINMYGNPYDKYKFLLQRGSIFNNIKQALKGVSRINFENSPAHNQYELDSVIKFKIPDRRGIISNNHLKFSNMSNETSGFK